MINKIIDFSINNKFIIGLFTLTLIGLGVWSMTQVPIDAVPDITNNQVQIITQSPNLGTEDIEQFVTYPVEIAMSNLPNVQEIRSVSRFGLSVVTIVFDDKIGTYLPRQLVAEKLPEVQDQIPAGFGEPTMGPIATGLGEIYQYTLEVDEEMKKTYTTTDLRTIQDWIVRRQMSMVSGVVEVNAFGGNQKQYEVAVNPNELSAIGITILEIFSALENNNQNTGGAYIERNHQANFIRGEGLARTTTDIENIVVKTVNNIPIKIKDVGTVSTGSAVRYGALTKDGKGEAVGGMILMLKGANSNEVIKNVIDRIAQIQKSLPQGVHIVPFLDRSELISKTTGTVKGNLLEGGLIVVFVLVLLLGNWRGGLIVASTIPLSLLFAFILMNVFDVWANLMSLGAIDFGIIVDGAVIIVEATVFLMYSHSTKKKITDTGSESNANTNKQALKDEIAAKSSKKMMNAAFFGQLIILIVFLPILALEGVEGKMFRPMALTFIFAMIGAMVLCLTYVPMISALFLKVPETKKASYGDKFVHWIERIYEKIVTKALTKGKIIITSAMLFFVFAVFLFTRMGGEFIPQLDEGDVAFHAILKPGSSLSETLETTTKIERIVKSEFPEVESIISRIGVADVPTDPMPMDIADVFVILKPNSEWTSADSKDELVAKMKIAISTVPGVNFEFTQPMEMRFNELLTGVREDVAIKLFGEDLEVLASKAEEMGKIIATIPGVADMKVEAIDGLPQITIHYNRNKVAQYGLTIKELNQIVQSAFAGGKAGVIFEGEKRFDLVVRLQEANRASINDVKNLYISLPSGAQIPLRELAEVSYKSGPMQISRDNTNRRTYVGINIRDRDVKSVVEDIKTRLDAEFELPPGYFIRYGGAFENLERASNKLQTVVPIALLLIFILIYFALKSLPQTVMIYLAIPMATIGGVFALWFRDMSFSISAGVGFIVLFGVAVLNGLVMISGLNELKDEGVTDLKTRIIEGTRRRIRPIMLTAFTDVLGFLPMAISSSAGAEVQRPLATVVIGGLLTSTLLTLFILPIFYQWVERRTAHKKQMNLKSLRPIGIILFLFIFPLANAQEIESVKNREPTKKASYPEITLDSAVVIARRNYPLLQTERLEIERQQVLKSSAYDFGSTQIFTSGEEISEEQGIYTLIGIGQQNIDILGIAAKKRLQNKRVALAEASYTLTEIQVAQHVKNAWSDVFQQKKKVNLYHELDAIYRQFSKAVALNFEVEAISRLEYAAAKNQALQIANKYQQAQQDYLISLQKLNLWFVSDTFYTVPDNFNPNNFFDLDVTQADNSHPEIVKSQLRVEEAHANYKVAKANLLPKFTIQGGLQKVNNVSGFYSYQAGISVPFFSGSDRSRIKASKIEEQIAQTEATFKNKQVKAAYAQAIQSYVKWKNAWLFYEQESLPLANEQRNGALLAYKEGAIEYTGFTLIIKDATAIEIEALEALDQYLIALFNLEYYTL
ncbi:heavy metal efflux pump, CzcA family [Cellulophaga algicola DSM 14237]|uniref:Heavy metal efflux pump, CzcA family n=1 Tax=Cellulophaga algicola (strain DSM 14237 / IC166 / ACAM 630) TaxID=688270 RepID=E6X8D5_CELAD|nr:CusA/CzcA family heavy metal efflux RND transporter [Cellulophaga algicola]ADV50791.1 heavy metal efflux pump, CzcA family [Cellulophaga algicola DSM 14237]